MGLTSWLRRRLGSDPGQISDGPDLEPDPERCLHFSIYGGPPPCGFEGFFRWTNDPRAVTCPGCLPKAQSIAVRDKVTLR